MAGLMPADQAGGPPHGTDIQSFATAMARICGWTVSAAAPGIPFPWRINTLELSAPDPRGASTVGLSHLVCPPGMFGVAATHPSDVLILTPLRGRIDLNINGRVTAVDHGQALVCQAQAFAGFTHAGHDGAHGLGLIRLNFRSVEQILFDPLHLPIDPDLQMNAMIDARSATTGGLFAMVSGLCSEAFIGQSRRASLRLQRNLIDGLSLMVLETIPHRYSDQMSRPSIGPLPSYVRLAREIMHSADGNAVSIADISTRAGVSVRTLELGFRAYLNITPAAYLRTVRLQRAHAMLKAGAGGRTVAEIGKACGLPHAGRFAEYYLQLFGETPSETRRRSEHLSG